MNKDVIVATLATTGTEMDFWETITHSGPVVFGVLMLLLLFSIIAWGIIIKKALMVRRSQAESASFLEEFWRSSRLDTVYQFSEDLHNSPVSQVFRAGYIELAKVKRSAEGEEQSMTAQLGGMENVQRSMRRTMASQITNLESMVPFLATVGSTAPFVGLFGTVWGIMKAFQEIGISGSASLAVVAPPIAEALIATAAGLAAAIPAVIAYNFFVTRIKVLATEMENFQADFLNIIKRHFKV